MQHPQILDVQPLAPRQELFYSSLSALLDVSPGPVSLHVSPVFPFEERRDQLEYDEKLFGRIFERSDRIRLVLHVHHPFWMPGRQEWVHPLDDGSPEADQFLIRRITRILEEISALSERDFHGVDILGLHAESRNSLRELICEDFSYEPSAIRFYDDAAQPARDRAREGFPALFIPGHFWEEQLVQAYARIGMAVPPELNGAVEDLQEKLDRCRVAWDRWQGDLLEALFLKSCAVRNLHSSNAARGLWPFSSANPGFGGAAAPGDTRDPGTGEFLTRMRELVEDRIEPGWMRRWIESLEMACGCLGHAGTLPDVLIPPSRRSPG